MSKIEVEKLGAVRRATIEIPDDGGISVLKGENGTGKSSTLAAVEKMMKRDAEAPTPTDGHDGGSIQGLGVTMTVRRSTRWSGELEVTALDSKLSISDLVDPGLADDRAADAKRMKAILAILQVRPTLDDWPTDEATADEMRAAYEESADLLSFAQRIKRRYEALARAAEAELSGHQKAFDVLAADPAVVAHDEPAPPASDDTLAADLTAAQKRMQELNDRATRAESAFSVAAAINDLKLRVGDEDADLEHVRALRDEANQLTKRVVEIDLEVERLNATLAASMSARAEIAKLEKTLAKATAPTPEELDAADAALTAARDAFSAANATRRLIDARKQASTHAGHISKLTADAEALRNAAKGVDAKLGEMVGERVPGMSFDDGLLLWQDAKRGRIRFGKLSPGQRATVACQVLINGLGAGGLGTLPQEFWEGLDPKNRRALAKLAKESGVVLITAECSADPALKSEIYTG